MRLTTLSSSAKPASSSSTPAFAAWCLKSRDSAFDTWTSLLMPPHRLPPPPLPLPLPLLPRSACA